MSSQNTKTAHSLAFTFDHLSVGYNKKPLIEDICIDIARGDIVTLIGPNGAGKSTILKSITRQLDLIGGRMIYDMRDMNEMSFRETAKKMAVVLTERPKTELMTCHDIVATGRYPYTGRLGILSEEDERKVDAAMAAVHAQDLGLRDFNAISDGQKQRIMLARAICQEPEVIILDEPTSFLDIRYKLELLSILRRMAKTNGITIIMTLHEIDLAQKIADRVVCVSGAHIVRYGTPDEIFKVDVIHDLYGIDNGSYEPLFGSIELAKPEGDTPAVFVISSGGSGLEIYRELQKTNTPFAAGILYENDIDTVLAGQLACRVLVEKPFEPISDAVFAEAAALVDRCARVIAADVPRGEINGRVFELIDRAKAAGKLDDRRSVK